MQHKHPMKELTVWTLEGRGVEKAPVQQRSFSTLIKKALHVGSLKT